MMVLVPVATMGLLVFIVGLFVIERERRAANRKQDR